MNFTTWGEAHLQRRGPITTLYQGARLRFEFEERPPSAQMQSHDTGPGATCVRGEKAALVTRGGIANMRGLFFGAVGAPSTDCIIHEDGKHEAGRRAARVGTHRRCG